MCHLLPPLLDFLDGAINNFAILLNVCHRAGLKTHHSYLPMFQPCRLQETGGCGTADVRVVARLRKTTTVA